VRPAPSFTNAAANSAAPSTPQRLRPDAQNARDERREQRVDHLAAKSLSSETQPNSLTCRGRTPGHRPGQPSGITSGRLTPGAAPRGPQALGPEAPADQRDREAAVGAARRHGSAQGEGLALRGTEVLPQLDDLAPSHRVAQRLGRSAHTAAPPPLRWRVTRSASSCAPPPARTSAPRVQADIGRMRVATTACPLDELRVDRDAAMIVLGTQPPSFDGQPGVAPSLGRVVRGLRCACDGGGGPGKLSARERTAS